MYPSSSHLLSCFLCFHPPPPPPPVFARLYLPNPPPTPQKLPILDYFHGGGFYVETAFSATYHPFLNSLAADASLLIVSIDYRRAPKHPIPTTYNDSWAPSNGSPPMQPVAALLPMSLIPG
ncbi:hypothetical protein AAC387_Pa11g1453 [Persea americana]